MLQGVLCQIGRMHSYSLERDMSYFAGCQEEFSSLRKYRFISKACLLFVKNATRFCYKHVEYCSKEMQYMKGTCDFQNKHFFETETCAGDIGYSTISEWYLLPIILCYLFCPNPIFEAKTRDKKLGDYLDVGHVQTNQIVKHVVLFVILLDVLVLWIRITPH